MEPSVSQGLIEGWAFRDKHLPHIVVIKEHIYADGQYLGEAETVWIKTDNNRFGLMPSHVYICPRCGEAWARRILDRYHWLPEMRRCFKCGDGTLLFDIERETHLPYSANVRELYLLCRDANNFP